MKQFRRVALTGLLALIAGVSTLPGVPGPRAQAQPEGKALRVVWQATLPSPVKLQATDTWGGPIFASLGDEALVGGIAGNDGTEYDYHSFSVFVRGQYTMCYARSLAAGWGGAGDCADSITVQVAQAFVTWPDSNSLGSYRSVASIVRGTGRFANAKGVLEIVIPFLIWQTGADWNSRGSGVVSGRVTGVQ